ncbi:MAG: hypothetical protein JTT11_07230 [Candidatus Brockarchaeota archaeon]|nr:hypothetical protein [Candidatus Brockarchaeota archaeon]
MPLETVGVLTIAAHESKLTAYISRPVRSAACSTIWAIRCSKASTNSCFEAVKFWTYWAKSATSSESSRGTLYVICQRAERLA